jgi:hypothetical protein
MLYGFNCNNTANVKKKKNKTNASSDGKITSKAKKFKGANFRGV